MSIVRQQFGRVSLVFVVLVTAIVCCFGFVMYDIYRDRLHTKIIENAERALTEGTAPISSREQDRQLRQAAYNAMIVAIKAADNAAFDEHLNEFKAFPAYGDYLVRATNLAIKQNNEHAGMTLLSLERTCEHRIDSISGLWVAASNAESDVYLEQLMNRNCGVKTAEDEKTLRSHIVRSNFPLLALSKIKGVENRKAVMPRMLSLAIDDDRITDVTALIEMGADPNSLHLNRRKSTVLEGAFVPGALKEEIALILIDAGAQTIIRPADGPPRYILLNAIDMNAAKVVKRILADDPEQITRENLFPELHSKLSRGRIFTSTPIFSALLNHGFNLNQEPRYGPSLMLRAIDNSDKELVELLLKHGVDPNNLYFTTTALERARGSTGAFAKEITQLLENEGAMLSVLDQVRSQRSGGSSCKRNKAKLIPNLDALTQRVNSELANLSNGKTIKPNESCDVLLSYCQNQGLGFDDCMNSSPACGEDVTVCCESSVVERYFEGRCAGLTVPETVAWLDYFPTTYGVPTVLGRQRQ